MDKIVWVPINDGQTIIGELVESNDDSYHIISNLYEYVIKKEPLIDKALNNINEGTKIWLRYCKNEIYTNAFYRVEIQ